MTLSQTELASLLCSRLCHDLLSPVGAMNNGLELLADETDPEMRERCLDLLADSARASAQKLKYFRLAFGAAGGFADAVQIGEPRRLVEGLVGANPRLKLDWQVTGETMPKPAVKLLLNFVLIAVEALVRGGQIDIAAESVDRHSEIVVRAAGDKIAADDTILEALRGNLDLAHLGPRTAAAHMMHLVAGENGGSIQVARDTGSLIIGAAIAA